MDSWWDIFGLVMIVLGAFAALVRAPMVISPAWAKALLRWMLRHRVMLHVTMLVFAVVGACFIWGARNITESRMDVALWAVWVMFVLGVLMAAGGLLFLAFPKLFVYFASLMKASPDVRIRVLAMLGVLAGAFIAYAGYVLIA